ncbi:Hint domain-containing protein [Rhodobacter maris]|uniref:Hint domain-containing protein n=1 Tax=Rhodobacter maris TaxID=446682 RepID=A0A285S5J4_9RHOB|nr:Hint domain-containing protein [Rhodobacter maris]SOC01849.1 Hint domain-containing protein [Rhodobacter maris]
MFGDQTARRARRWTAGVADQLPLAAFRPAQQSGTISTYGLAEGIVAGTHIATAMGWRPVEAITAGDLVMTFDHGLRPVRRITRAPLFAGPSGCPRPLMPLAVPTGALGNGAPLLLLPEQSVLVESDLAEIRYGDPFALIPAAALEGWRGIDRITPHQRTEVVVLECDTDEVLYANGTGLIHCGAVHGQPIDAFLEQAAGYTVLPMKAAREIVAHLMAAQPV